MSSAFKSVQVIDQISHPERVLVANTTHKVISVSDVEYPSRYSDLRLYAFTNRLKAIPTIILTSDPEYEQMTGAIKRISTEARS
jgi:hypothetical protein